jgi:hypothetical protein
MFSVMCAGFIIYLQAGCYLSTFGMLSAEALSSVDMLSSGKSY